ncbi:hypothetical protein ABH917_000675 [Thermobifida halotolerans]
MDGERRRRGRAGDEAPVRPAGGGAGPETRADPDSHVPGSPP